MIIIVLRLTLRMPASSGRRMGLPNAPRCSS